MERLTDYFGVLNSFQNDFSHKNKKELRRKKNMFRPGFNFCHKLSHDITSRGLHFWPFT